MFHKAASIFENAPVGHPLRMIADKMKEGAAIEVKQLELPFKNRRQDNETEKGNEVSSEAEKADR